MRSKSGDFHTKPVNDELLEYFLGEQKIKPGKIFSANP
jgi:hypothetical protein